MNTYDIQINQARDRKLLYMAFHSAVTEDSTANFCSLCISLPSGNSLEISKLLAFQYNFYIRNSI